MQVGTLIKYKMTKGQGAHLVKSPFVVFRCDFCNELRTKAFAKIRSELHYCNRNCADAGRRSGQICRTRIEAAKIAHDPTGEIRETKRRQTMVKRFGSYLVRDIPGMIEKISDGTKSGMASGGTARMKKTMLELYGFECSFNVPESRKKSEETCQERYGATHFVKSEEFKKLFENPEFVVNRTAKSRAKWIENFGVDHPLKSAVVLARMQENHLLEYGVRNPMQRKSVKQSVSHTNLERYGVKCPLSRPETIQKTQSLEVKQRAFRTLLSRKKGNSSKIELEFIEELKKNFGHDKVTNQAIIERWIADCYIVDLDCYVFFDGVYWHGLNRSLEEIQASPHPRDRRIEKARDADARRNNWFAENQKKIVIITDDEFKLARKNFSIDDLLQEKGLIHGRD